MSETNESTEQEFTHYIVAQPHPEGIYKAPDGTRVNLHKFKKEKSVNTKHPKFRGTTITNFIKQSDYKKA